MTMLHGQHRGLMRAIDRVISERFAQHKKWGEQNHSDGTGRAADVDNANRAKALTDRHAETGDLTWRDILAEEFFEALAESDEDALKTELVQVAAVATAWVEAIERRSA